MDRFEPIQRRRGLVAIDGAMALIAILLVVQVWLLSATLEAFLAEHTSPFVPTAIFSGWLFGACAALNFFLEGIDRGPRQRSLRNVCPQRRGLSFIEQPRSPRKLRCCVRSPHGCDSAHRLDSILLVLSSAARGLSTGRGQP